jgi:histone deacetylase HOS2
MLLGGGGYTARNVARAWCHETALATENELPDAIPLDFIPRPEAFHGRGHGDGKLFPAFTRTHPNYCSNTDLENMVKKIEWDLKYVANAPWVQMDQLPRKSMMDTITADIDEDRKHNRAEKDRKQKERDPAGRGELR